MGFGLILMYLVILNSFIFMTFSIVSPSTWNGLSLEVRILPKIVKVSCLRLILCRRGWAGAPLSRFLEGVP